MCSWEKTKQPQYAKIKRHDYDECKRFEYLKNRISYHCSPNHFSMMQYFIYYQELHIFFTTYIWGYGYNEWDHSSDIEKVNWKIMPNHVACVR